MIVAVKSHCLGRTEDVVVEPAVSAVLRHAHERVVLGGPKEHDEREDQRDQVEHEWQCRPPHVLHGVPVGGRRDRCCPLGPFRRRLRRGAAVLLEALCRREERRRRGRTVDEVALFCVRVVCAGRGHDETRTDGRSGQVSSGRRRRQGHCPSRRAARQVESLDKERKQAASTNTKSAWAAERCSPRRTKGPLGPPTSCSPLSRLWASRCQLCTLDLKHSLSMVQAASVLAVITLCGRSRTRARGEGLVLPRHQRKTLRLGPGLGLRDLLAQCLTGNRSSFPRRSMPTSRDLIACRFSPTGSLQQQTWLALATPLDCYDMALHA